MTSPGFEGLGEIHDRAGFGYNEPSVDALATEVPGAPWFDATDGAGAHHHVCRTKRANIEAARIISPLAGASLPRSAAAKVAVAGSGHPQLPNASGWRVTTGKMLEVISMTKFGR